MSPTRNNLKSYNDRGFNNEQGENISSKINFLKINEKIIVNPQEGEQILNQMNKENNKLKILVQLTEEENAKEQTFVKSKDIICPECHQPCIIKSNNYKLSLLGCIQNHKTNLKIKDFLQIKIYIIICPNQILDLVMIIIIQVKIKK